MDELRTYINTVISKFKSLIDKMDKSDEDLSMYAKYYQSLPIAERAIIHLNDRLETLQADRDQINNECTMLADSNDIINDYNDKLRAYDVRDLSFYQIIKIKLGC